MRQILLLFLLFPLLSPAQPKFQVNDIGVLRNGNPMQNPWVGGLNNPVFSPMDINNDGMMDLFVYDKAGWKAMAFINTGSVGHASYTYAPQYDMLFPQGLRDWALVRDYNHDGIGDIFALTSNSDIAVYKGYRSGNFLGYNLVNPHLMYSFGVNTIHIWTFADNMPVIMDVDGDGDMDILAPDQAGGLTLDFYKNEAIDSGYNSDSLVFRIADQCWGRFIENSANCGIELAQCKKELRGPGDPPADLRHQGGACCGFHYRNNNVTSLLLADSYCNSLKFLENTGDTTYSNVTNYDTIFPRYDVSVNMNVFPCAYTLDADNDGYEDLFVSPFASNAYQEGQSEDKKVVQYYRNTGVDSVKRYHYLGDTIMTNGIIDVGTESHPVFFDYDGDGLMDIVTGNYGEFSRLGYPRSYLALYKNIGTDTMPAYQEQDLDWNHLSAFQLNGIYPAFGDMDGDGHADMVIGDAFGNISFFRNAGGATASYPTMTAQNWFGINVGANAAPFLCDINGDGLLDLVIGSKSNNIMYFWNFGTRTNPQFSADSSNSFFGKIRVYDTHVVGQPPGYATPFITRQNNALVLYSGSQRGITYEYAINTDSLKHGTFALLDSDVLGVKPGLRSTINIADINHDGHNEYLVGNIRGGMSIYSDTNWGGLPVIASVAAPLAERGGIMIYPNPAKDHVICKTLKEGMLWEAVQLFDMQGSLIQVHYGKIENGINIDLEGIADGIYVIQVRDQSGEAYQNKIIIFRY